MRDSQYYEMHAPDYLRISTESGFLLITVILIKLDINLLDISIKIITFISEEIQRNDNDAYNGWEWLTSILQPHQVSKTFNKLELRTRNKKDWSRSYQYSIYGEFIV